MDRNGRKLTSVQLDKCWTTWTLMKYWTIDKMVHCGHKLTKIDTLDIIEKFGLKWTKLDSLDITRQYVHNLTMWR